jgi:endonuclease YncB( thermonuclease family)
MQRTVHPSALPARVLDPSRIHTIDGESFEYGGERFRIRGIDAMSLADGWQRLDELLHLGPVTVVPTETDSLGRTVAEVLVNNHDLSNLLSSR